MENNYSDIDIDAEYATYDGLGRRAYVFGMPMIPAILIVIFFLVIGLFLMPVLEIKAMLVSVLALPCLWFLRTVTARDDQALRITVLELMWWFHRRNTVFTGNTLLISATKFERSRHDYLRFLGEDSEKAARAARLFAECQSTR